jgi:hypothetical protein
MGKHEGKELFLKRGNPCAMTLAPRLQIARAMKNDDLATSRSQQVLDLVRSWAEEERRCESTVFDESSGWFRLTLIAVRDGDRWEIADLHLSPAVNRLTGSGIQNTHSDIGIYIPTRPGGPR